MRSGQISRVRRLVAAARIKAAETSGRIDDRKRAKMERMASAALLAALGRARRGRGPDDPIPGIPRLYTPILGREICERLTAGESISSICADGHMPSAGTLAHWARYAPLGGEDFPAEYLAAREAGMTALVDLAMDLALDGTRDMETDGDGVERVSLDHIARIRLACDQIRWTASKIARREYGESGALAGLAGAGSRVTVTIETVGGPPAPEPPGPRTFNGTADPGE